MSAPKYLTISDDLQIVPGEGCRFLSASHKDLVAVEIDVEDWVEVHADHPRREEAARWLGYVAEELQRRLSIEGRKRLDEIALREMEKAIRLFVRATGRRKGWSREKIREEANRKAASAARFLDMD